MNPSEVVIWNPKERTNWIITGIQGNIWWIIIFYHILSGDIFEPSEFDSSDLFVCSEVIFHCQGRHYTCLCTKTKNIRQLQGLLHFTLSWGFPKIGVPQNGWFNNGQSIYKWMILGYPYFRKSPYCMWVEMGDSKIHLSSLLDLIIFSQCAG